MPLNNLNVAVVGGGPSGLFLAHRLLRSGAKVTVLEGRTDPRLGGTLEERSYALGLGIRGRTAIRTIDESLWQAIKARGFESEKFTLFVNSIPIVLRNRSKDTTVEPSLLMYQTDLCAALLDEMDKRFYPSQYTVRFDTKVKSCDVFDKTIDLEAGPSNVGPFDLIVGCDGVNSPVRASLDEVSERFETSRVDLPGEFKVVRLAETPEKLDPTTVGLILPKSGTVGAFVEPTARGCCILFSSRYNTTDDILMNPPDDLSVTAAALEDRFPLLTGADFDDMAKQLADQRGGRASSVRCNTYHFGSSVVLCGDAAHATGGVSGQGVNSALVDAQVLADCLVEEYEAGNREDSLAKALLAYSQKQVPEGKALYDLSFGPNPKGLLRLRYLIRAIFESLWRGRFGVGRKPLQTLLTTSLTPFSEIRKKKDKYYDEPLADLSESLAVIAEKDMAQFKVEILVPVLRK